MRAFVQRGVFVLLALFAAREDGLRGQWKIVASALGGTSAETMAYCDGVLWAGGTGVWHSSDSGKTWRSSNFSGAAHDIHFLDRTTGLVAGDGGVFLTHDGGQTWRNILVLNKAYQVAFNGSARVIHALEHPNGTMYTSFDSGSTWTRANVSGSGWGLGFAVATDGSLYMVWCDFDALVGTVSSSTDLGRTWPIRSTQFDGDAYSISVDSCDPKRICIANENCESAGDMMSHLRVSTDAGTTWQTTASLGSSEFSGTLATCSHTIYTGTSTQGIKQSTDRGMTWRNIGGPPIGQDTRLIAAINDSVLLSVDRNGNVWRTDNSGGFSRAASSPSSFAASPAKIFSSDTISCDSVSRSVFFSRSGCPPVFITKWLIVGTNSGSYKASNLSNDSILITLYGTKQGNQNAELLFILSNGSNDTVNLAGYVIPSVPLSLSSSNETSDTLGGSVFVPITITGLTRPEDIDLVLHYDPTLAYNSSTDAANTKLDIPGEQWPGRSKLHIAQAVSGVVAGYAHFTVFADSGAKTQVTFDSLTVLSAVSPCEYTLPNAVTSTITPPSGCGTAMLSQYLQSGQIPNFSIRPNPTTGNVELTSSLNLGDASVEVYDMLGTKRGAFAVTLAKDAPAHLTLPQAPTLGAGIYYLRVRSVAGVTSLRVVVAR